MNRVRIKLRFKDPASNSKTVVTIDSVDGTRFTGALWPADHKFVQAIEQLIEANRNRYPKQTVPKSKVKK